MALRITPIDESYKVSETFNDLTKYWTSQGYVTEGGNLVKREQIQRTRTKVTPLSSKKRLKVAFGGGGGRTRLSLKRAFKPFLNENVVAVINGKVGLRVRRKDKAINVTKYFKKGEELDVVIGEATKLTETVTEEDKIPIIQITYSVFIKGEYKPRNKPVDRRFYVNGNKTIKLGIREPKGMDGGQFWSKLFRDLKNNVLDELITKLREEHSFSDELLASSSFEIKKGFPQDTQGFRGGL